MARLPSKGRKKIPLKKIEDEKGRAVTLSKRYNGLFKKAGEIATLCGAYIAIIIFTIGGKPLSFGSPCFQSVKNKFFNPDQVVNQQPKFSNQKVVNSYHATKLQGVNQRYTEVNENLINKRKKAQIVDENVIAFLGGKTYDEYTGTCKFEEMARLKDRLEELKIHMERHCYAEIGSSSSNDDYIVDLSKIEVPEDYLKL